MKHIAIGSVYYRHDPHFYYSHEELGRHWCFQCILTVEPKAGDPGRNAEFLIPAVRVLSGAMGPDPERLQPLRVEVVGVGELITNQIRGDLTVLHKISPAQFEEFICDRLYAMGLEPKQVGSTNRKDGGVDIIFWPRQKGAFPFLGAAQVKHRRNPLTTEGPSSARDFAGVLASHPFSAGLLISNTTFSPDAQWFAREHAKLMRLRDIADIRRWLIGHYTDEAEWREMPSSLELCPGVVIPIR